MIFMVCCLRRIQFVAFILWVVLFEQQEFTLISTQ